LHLVVDATGALTLDGQGLEKRLQELDSQRLLRSLQVNAVGPALLLRHLSPLLARGERVIWAKLSAQGLLQALDAAPATGRALFLDHRGEPIPW